MKVKAHALFFSLVVALLIAIICSSLILYGYYNRVILYQHQHKISLSENASSGISYLLSLTDEIDETKDLFGDGNDSVSLKKQQWGFYEVLSSKAFSRGKSAQQMVICGIANNDQTALYLLDQNKKLSLTGRTKIAGKAYLPKAGITRGYIGGNSYIGSQLVYGSSLTSSNTLPTMNEEFLNKLIGQWKKEGESVPDSIDHPFDQETKIVNAEGVLSGVYKGNVIFTSGYPVVVSSQCQLENVILIAPSIMIERGFKGHAQFFAMDSLKVEENVTLDYPSFIGLIKRETDNQVRPFIAIEKGSAIYGGILAYQKEYDRAKTIIKIAPSVRIDGLVYSNGFVQHEGDLRGKIICSSFYLSTSSSVYENYLKDAIIDRDGLDDAYVWPLVLKEDLSGVRHELRKIGN